MNSNFLQLVFRFFRGWSSVISRHWWIHSRKRRRWITLQIHNMIRLMLRQSYIIIATWVCRRSFSKSISSRCHRYKLSIFLIDVVIRYWYDNSILIIVSFRCFSPLMTLSMLRTYIGIRLMMMLLLMICIGWCWWGKICQSLKCVIFVTNISSFMKFFI